MIELDKSVLQVLEKMQTIAPSFVSGGYLRDKIIGIMPNDIDILTEMTIDEVKTLFPNLQGTERGLEFGVGRFSKGSFQFEITSISGSKIEEVTSHKDFVLNSLYHDGKTLFDPYHAVEDIKTKVIRSLDDPNRHFMTNPQAYLRAIRFTGQLGFSLDKNLLSFLKENRHFLHENNESRIQQEGYKIIRSTFPLHAFLTIHELGLVHLPENGTSKPFDSFQTFPVLEDKLSMRLLLMSQYTGIDFIYEFIDYFQMTKQLKEQIHYLLPYLGSDDVPYKPHMLNKVILLKKHQYENEPEKFKQFLDKIRNQKTLE